MKIANTKWICRLLEWSTGYKVLDIQELFQPVVDFEGNGNSDKHPGSAGLMHAALVFFLAIFKLFYRAALQESCHKCLPKKGATFKLYHYLVQSKSALDGALSSSLAADLESKTLESRTLYSGTCESAIKPLIKPPLNSLGQPRPVQPRIAPEAATSICESTAEKAVSQALSLASSIGDVLSSQDLSLESDLFAMMKQLAQDQPVAMRGTQTHRKATSVLHTLAASLGARPLEIEEANAMYYKCGSISRRDLSAMGLLNDRVMQAIQTAINHRLAME